MRLQRVNDSCAATAGHACPRLDRFATTTARSGGLRNRVDHLKTRGQAKEAKYGKFIYERAFGSINVSRMVKRHGRWGVEAVTQLDV